MVERKKVKEKRNTKQSDGTVAQTRHFIYLMGLITVWLIGTQSEGG